MTIKLAVDPKLLVNVAEELSRKAKQDKNKCFGYFPALIGKKNIDTDLPACQKFAELLPTITVDDKNLQFNFVRMSLVQQKADSPFHLDTDAATALTGDVTTLDNRLVWRLLINLNPEASRTLGYLNVDTRDVELGNDGSYVHCIDARVEKMCAQEIVMPPANSMHVSAVLFCASRVLHTGKDDKNGHFVAGYGCEEVL